MHKDLAYLDSLKTLLGPIPSRKSILQTPTFPVHRSFNIRVERNSPFEFIQYLMPSFLRLWGAQATVNYSEYDNTLSNMSSHENMDAYIIWIDWRLYRDSLSAKNTAEWFEQRIQVLRSHSSKPILFNNWYEEWNNGEALFSPYTNERSWVRELNEHLIAIVKDTSGCELIDLSGLTHQVSGSFYDTRNDQVSHFPFSDEAAIVIARHLGIHLFPAIFQPRIKTIVLDLDDTLYQGVIGEDGVEGIVFTEGHLQLQRLLLKLKQSGILLAICSRNEIDDVKFLFEQRRDLPLKWEDFASICANWQPKAENIYTISQQLNIDPSDFLFIDDNAAELLKVSGSFPSIRILQAEHDGLETKKRLLHYPGLYQLHSDSSASLRTGDIQANEKRDKLKASAMDYNAYLAELKMVVKVYKNHLPHTKRLSELSQKTNQFNLALRRINLVEAEQMMTSNKYWTFTIQLTDCLSDSGTIGAFIFEVNDKNAVLREVIFSCRALGREVETLSFAYCLNELIRKGVSNLDISIEKGPRNKPALEWIHRFIDESSENLLVQDLYQKVKASCTNHPAKVEEII